MGDSAHKSYISIGSNLGDRKVALASAVKFLQRDGLAVERLSCVYETAPVDCARDTPLFLNAVIEGDWKGTAKELLLTALEIEKECGRTRAEKNAARILDIDILLCGNEICSTTDITLPHPRMHKRLFVLVPLCELAAEKIHPVIKKTYKELRTQCHCSAQQSVKLVAPPGVSQIRRLNQRRI
jgi:2-amino-4-hydroxy-6-hydroxymethyldihydropteridine diphosphokinase